MPLSRAGLVGREPRRARHLAGAAGRVGGRRRAGGGRAERSLSLAGESVGKKAEPGSHTLRPRRLK